MAQDLNPQMVDLFRRHHGGVLATIRRDGRPQLSNVGYAYDDERPLIRISTTDDAVKVRNLRRDPRAVFHVTTANRWSYAVADATAELTPVSVEPDDATADELVDLYRTIAGEHPDWQEFREAMVSERRLVLRLHVEHVYGLIR